MAAGFMRELGQGRVEVLSAGSAPKDSINPVAVAAMAEVGIDIANNTPKVLTPEAVQESDAVITMGCYLQYRVRLRPSLQRQLG